MFTILPTVKWACGMCSTNCQEGAKKVPGDLKTLLLCVLLCYHILPQMGQLDFVYTDLS